MWAVLWTLCLVSSCLAFPNLEFIRGNKNQLYDLLNPNSVSPIISTTESVSETTTPTPSDCKCVPYYQCRENSSEIITNGERIIENRLKLGVDCPEHHQCCRIPQIKTSTVCGQSRSLTDRITGSDAYESDLGEYPWMVQILKQELGSPNEPKHQCGGSLIHKQVVLTAGHCVRRIKLSQLKIRAGELDTRTTLEIRPHQERSVRNVIIHKNFGVGTLFYDFAILILSEPVDFMDNISPVCLPEQDAVNESACVVSGWGKAKFDVNEEYQTVLRSVNLSVVPHDLCQTKLRETRLGEQFRLHESFICAGGGNGRDSCKGDGGGPLVCRTKEDSTRYQQVGIVSWGINCGTDTPGVYSNVVLVRDWIEEQIASHVSD